MALRLLTAKTSEKWVYLEDNADGSRARVLLTPMSGEEIDRLRQKFTKQEFKRGVPYEKIDNIGFSRALYPKMAKDWENIQDEDGVPIPFSKEALLDAVNRNADFASDLTEKSKKLVDQENAVKETARKNSKSGESGTPAP